MKTMKRIVVLACVFCLMLSFAGCGKLEISREIATVNGRIATKAEFMYYLDMVKQQMLSESGTTDAAAFWDAEIDGVKASEAAKKKALEEMLRVEIACIKAEEKGISVSSDDLRSIRNFVNAKSGEEKAEVDNLLDITGLSRKQLMALLEKTVLANLYVNELSKDEPEPETDVLIPTEEEIKEAYEKEYVHVKHILISNTETPAEGAEPQDPEAYKAEQKKLAEDVLKKAKAGTNFDSLVKEYGEDPGMEQSPDGYTFTTGAMVPAFETASYELEVGEISELVETEYGWHIIKKFALPTSGEEYDAAIKALEEKLTSDKQAAYQKSLTDKYNAVLDGYKPEMEIVIHQKVVDGIKVK